MAQWFWWLVLATLEVLGSILGENTFITGTPYVIHQESWNPSYGWVFGYCVIPYGIYKESTRNPYGICKESVWIPQGMYVLGILILSQIPGKFHWDSIWNLPGICVLGIFHSKSNSW
jgi:hypothetical protein